MEELKKTLRMVLAAFGDESVRLLREYHEQAGQRTTGGTIDQFATTQEEQEESIKQVVVGADHIEHLERGRGPGGFPPLQNIRQWAEAKGLFAGLEKEYQKKGLVYIIGRKIAQEGSIQHRTGATFSGFESPIGKAFDEARIEQLKQQLGESFSLFMNSTFLKQWQQQQ
jgi:hypothetical protein